MIEMTPQEIDVILEQFDQTARPLQRQIVAAQVTELFVAMYERAELIAALRASHEALEQMIELHGGEHDETCPQDDTCDCDWKEYNRTINEGHEAGRAVLSRIEQKNQTGSLGAAGR